MKCTIIYIVYSTCQKFGRTAPRDFVYKLCLQSAWSSIMSIMTAIVGQFILLLTLLLFYLGDCCITARFFRIVIYMCTFKFLYLYLTWFLLCFFDVSDFSSRLLSSSYIPFALIVCIPQLLYQLNSANNMTPIK